MRRSRYAIEATGKAGEHLLFSAATGGFAQLNDAAWRAWREMPDGDGQSAEPARGESDDPNRTAAYAELARLGLLTNCSVEEELDRQRAIFDCARADTSALTLSFVPTYVCNFRCPYCYELGHNKVKGKMDDRIMQAICDFVDWKHRADRFGTLSVQWYGGDPSLALDVVEELSQRLMSWCADAGVEYDAMMLTNANVIGEAEARIIARCGVSSIMLTIDGPEEVHNKRRVAANGTNSYQRTMEAARLLQGQGIHLFATMNVDKVNLPYFNELRQTLLAEAGIVLSTGKLNDYGHFYGEAPFCAPEFDLFTHEEYFEAQFAEFCKTEHDANELREMLRPVDRFCTGQLNNYFVIDLLGDVYRCDGWVGDTSHVRFNLFDDRSTWKLEDITFDATRDDTCVACEILPLCQGNCIWERECSGMPCHPFRTTIGGYLGLYRASLDDAVLPSPTGGVTVLAPPFPSDAPC